MKIEPYDSITGAQGRTFGIMCRSIKTLRAPYAYAVTDEDVRAAALQYVQTLSGYRAPSPADAAAFELAVERIQAVTRDLLDHIQAPAMPAAGA